MKVSALFLPLLLAIGCSPAREPGPDIAAEEKAIRQAEAEWSKAAAAGNVDAVVAYYTEDARLMPPNAPMAMGTQGIRTAWTGMMALPAASLSWETNKVEVAASGDLAWSYGAYNMSYNMPQGQPVSDRGKYLTVWKRQPSGAWKCVADIFNSDLPAAAPQPASVSPSLQPPLPAR